MSNTWTCPDCKVETPGVKQSDTSTAKHTSECRRAVKGFAGSENPVSGWGRKKSPKIRL